jgi:CheY-like chemotaxis protein
MCKMSRNFFTASVENNLTMSNNQPILLVEDDSNDVLLVQRTFQKAGLLNSLNVVRDGEQAIKYLRGDGDYADRQRFPLPFLMLLDLKMPGMDGFEVLRWVRSESDLKRLLVVVLTSSNLQKDVDWAYELGANSYLVKPVGSDEMANLIQRFEVYWTEINRTTYPAAPKPMPHETLLR